MELNDRKKAILQAIVDAYIDTAEPVGSRTISKMEELGLSSATIRNEMADLEEMGYLGQPHSSAGRIPSDLGYRFYVDTLMQRYDLTLSEMQRINSVLKSMVREFDMAIAGVSKIVSDLTRYTTVALSPRLDKTLIKKFDIIAVDERHFVVVVITSAGSVKNRTFLAKDPVPEEMLRLLARTLNEHIAQKALSAVTLEKLKALFTFPHASDDVLLPVIGYVSEMLREELGSEIYLGGVHNIFNYPEFSDLKKARDFIDLLDNRQEVLRAFENGEPEGSKKTVKVTIGTENKVPGLRESSVVRADYKIGGKTLGSIGLIGPTRMNYAKTMSELDYFVRGLNRLLSQMTLPDGGEGD